MGIEEYIRDTTSFLELDKFSEKGKRKSIIKLLEKLEDRKDGVEKILTKKHGKKLKKKLKDDLRYIESQIKKGHKYLA